MKRASLALCCAAGCAHISAPPLQPDLVQVGGSAVTLSAEAAADSGEVERLAGLTAEALPILQRWGGLRVPTRIVVVPDHAALELRALRPGYGWLRAWARYDVVYVQSPSTWRFLFRPSQHELRGLLTHELTHCAMYQAVSDGRGWSRVVIPLWFREGMASWTAEEADKRYTVADLHAFLVEHPDLDPLRGADDMVRDNSRLVYGAAHWAFDQLAVRGPDRIVLLLHELRDGMTFPQAFAAAFGESEDDFEDQVLSSWRSFPAKPKVAKAVGSSERRL